MSLTTAERFARYMNQPASWASREALNDWHHARDRSYRITREWTERNKDMWGNWFLGCSPAQRRRIRKKMHRDYQPDWAPKES